MEGNSDTLVYADIFWSVPLATSAFIHGYLQFSKNTFNTSISFLLLISVDASFCDVCSVLNTFLPLLTEMMHNELKTTTNMPRHFSLPTVIESPRNVQVLGNLDRLGVCNNWRAVICTARITREGTAEIMSKNLI